MPEKSKISEALFIEKWARESEHLGDSGFRNRVYEIFEKYGIDISRGWELTNDIFTDGSKYAHFFESDIDIEEKSETSQIWQFIEALTYLRLLEEWEAPGTLPKQRSKLMETSLGKMKKQRQDVLKLHSCKETLETILPRFSWQFPEPIAQFFTEIKKTLAEKISTEKQVVEHVKKESRKRPGGDVAKYIRAVDELKSNVLKKLAPHLETAIAGESRRRDSRTQDPKNTQERGEKEPKVLLKEPKVLLIDSGEWANENGYSEPRMYPPLREMAGDGKFSLDAIKFIRSPVLDRPFKEEESNPGIYDKRHEMRRCEEEARVRRTAISFGLLLDEKDEKDEKASLEEFIVGDSVSSPMVCVNMRPGKSNDDSLDRNSVLKSLINEKEVKRIIVAPPYFSNINDLNEIKKIDKENKIVLWTPYRYAEGIVYARDKLEKRGTLGGASLVVTCGPFEILSFIREFALAFIDALLSVTGGIEIGSMETAISAPNGLPILSVTAKHEVPAKHEDPAKHEGALITLLLSTNGGSFQNIDHASLKLLFTDMSHIVLSKSFSVYEHFTPERHYSNGFSHDPRRSDINGSRALLEKACFSGAGDDILTLDNFEATQAFLDRLLEEIHQWREA